MHINRLLALISIVLIFAGCKDRDQPPVPASSTANILLLLKAPDNPFFQDIERGARQAVQASGRVVNLQVRSGESESDVAGQRKALEWFYAEYGRSPKASGTAAVLITPSASQRELTEQLLGFRKNGIPVVLLDTRIDQKALADTGLHYTAYFGSNNREGGRMAAQEVLQDVPSVQHVLLLGGVEGQETAVARREGFMAEITAKVPTVQITERTCNWRRNEARKTVEALLGAGKKFDAIFAANDEMALGAVEAIEASGSPTGPKVIVGFDAIPEARAAVKAGRLTATIAQSPFDMGRMAIECVLDAQMRNSSMIDKDVPLKVIRK